MLRKLRSPKPEVSDRSKPPSTIFVEPPTHKTQRRGYNNELIDCKQQTTSLLISKRSQTLSEQIRHQQRQLSEKMYKDRIANENLRF